MTDLTLPLEDPRAQVLARSGGKGATLARISAAGLPVPSGFVVTTAALDPEPIDAIARTFGDLVPSDLAALQQASDRIQAAIADGLTDAVRTQILAAHAALAATAVSVRSSATAEDLADASFAGQYRSFLNVRGPDDLLDRIQQVWASLHSPHAISYRQRHRIAHDQVRMAVVVQIQLAPDAAGVLFTRDPLDGARRHIASAALGLGEGVVSGAAPCDSFALDADTGQVLSSDIAAKTATVTARAGGGIETVAVGDARQQTPALADAHLQTLADLGRQLETLLGGPQDIEFARTGDDLHILQARPITTIEPALAPDEPWDRGLDAQYEWTLRSRRSSPAYRLEEDYWGFLMDQMRACYENTGSPMAARHIGHLVNGHFYGRAPVIDEDTLKARHARHAARFETCDQEGTTYYESVLRPLIEDRLATLKRQRARVTGPADQVAYLQASMETAAYVMGNLHWSMVRPGRGLSWPKEYHELTGRPAIEAHIFMQAIQNRMTRLVATLRKLARIVQGDHWLAALFAARDFAGLDAPYLDSTFRDGFKRMLAIYGLRTGRGYGSNTAFATPTWNMDPSIALEMIAAYAEQDLDQLDRHDRQARAERDNAIRRTRRQLAADPEKLARFNTALKTETDRVRRLENHNYLMEQCTWGTMREALWAMGQQLVEHRRLDRPDDVLHLSLEELHALDDNADLRAIVGERVALRERRMRMHPPDVLGQKGEEAIKESDEKIGLEGRTIYGRSASGGRVKGTAVVVNQGRERPQVYPGDILVAANLGPEWTPLFGIVGGLVLDQGSLTQHAAIVAREYRIPSVMMTRDATGAITDGQTIAVDGDRGVVELDI